MDIKHTGDDSENCALLSRGGACGDCVNDLLSNVEESDDGGVRVRWVDEEA
jgi:hypothetical protein